MLAAVGVRFADDNEFLGHLEALDNEPDG